MTGVAEVARPRRNVLVRAVIVSIAVVMAALPGAVVLGGYVPDLPTLGLVGGLYLTTDLPAVVVPSLVSLGLAIVALRLGGGRYTRALAAVIGLVLAGGLLAAGQLLALAAAHDARYAPVRLGPAPGYRAADERVVFATVEGIDLHADLWRPFRRADGSAPAPGPAMVFVHGGAFVGGDLGSRPWLFQAVTDAGFTVIDIEYRLAPPPRWQDAPGDVLCALAWVAEHANELAIDPARVTLAGDSSGGSLALVAGYSVGSPIRRLAGPAMHSSCGGSPVVPAGIVAIEPAADLEGLWQDRTIDDGSPAFPEAYIGGPPSALPDRYAAASPFSLIHAGVPPTLIVTGANDHLVRLPRVRSIADALDRDGARYELIVIPFAEHGLDGLPTTPGSQLLEALLPRFVGDAAAVIRD